MEKPLAKPKFLNRQQKQEISDLAEGVVAEYSGATAIQPLTIIKQLKITYDFDDYGEAFDGLLDCKNGKFHIHCNLGRVEHPESPRARFTLAHELGHYFLDAHRNALLRGMAPSHASFCEYESKEMVEQEADCFAASLLMPASRFKDAAKKAGQGLPGILKLKQAFQTSVASTAIRYAGLGIKPCVVMKWNNNGYQWKWLSSEAREAGISKTIELKSQIPPGSVTDEALNAKLNPASGYFQRGTLASAWFPRIFAGSQSDIILLEQAVHLGRFGVLTFLMPETGGFVPWE